MSKHETNNRVSIIVAAFNAAETIRDTVESVRRQTHDDIEIIVVDDGSTDDTASVVLSLGPEINLLQQKNSGPAAARNAGVASATGTWLAFIDADDLWEPDKLERQLLRATESEADLIYTNVRPIGDCDDLSNLQHQPGQMPQGQVLAQLQLDNFVTLSSVLITREAFADLGGFKVIDSIPVAEDWELWLRYAESGRAMSACEQPLVQYRWSKGGLSGGVMRMHEARLSVLNHHAESMGDRMTRAELLKAKASAHACSAWAARRNNMWLAYGRFYISRLMLNVAARISKKTAREPSAGSTTSAMSNIACDRSGMITSICRNTVASLEESIRLGYYPAADRKAIAPVIGALLVLSAKYQEINATDPVLQSLDTSLHAALSKHPELAEHLESQLSSAPEMREAILGARTELVSVTGHSTKTP